MPSLFLTSVDCHLCADASPEAGCTCVFLLKGDPPSPGVQAHCRHGCITADALPARCPDNEEITHNLHALVKAANEHEACKGLVAVRQVATSARVFEEVQQPCGFVEPAAAGHVAPELRQVVAVQLPQALSDLALLASGDQLERRSFGHTVIMAPASAAMVSDQDRSMIPTQRALPARATCCLGDQIASTYDVLLSRSARVIGISHGSWVTAMPQSFWRVQLVVNDRLLRRHSHLSAVQTCEDARRQRAKPSKAIVPWVIFTGVLPWGSSAARVASRSNLEGLSERQATVRRMQSLRVRY